METEIPITLLLQRWRGGDPAALDTLLPLVYDQLRALAARRLHGEAKAKTLGVTGLVHEAYLRLVGTDIPWEDRSHFFAIAARTMRRILVDNARSGMREKRGGGAVRVTFDEGFQAATFQPEPLLAIDQALDNLSNADTRKAQAVELCFFGGLTQPEAADVLGVSVPTLERELRFAKAWLRKELG